MKTIGVDLDDVLLNFVDAFLVFSNKNYSPAIKREQVTSFNMEEVWGTSSEEMHQRIQLFYHSEEHNLVGPVNGAVEAIAKLSEKNILHIVTASPKELEEKISTWLSRHFKKSFEKVHFTRKNIFESSPRKKADICKELGIEVFVEDSLQNAKDISEAGIPVFLINTPWNQGEIGPLVTRVDSWKEIVKNPLFKK